MDSSYLRWRPNDFTECTQLWHEGFEDYNYNGHFDTYLLHPKDSQTYLLPHKAKHSLGFDTPQVYMLLPGPKLAIVLWTYFPEKLI